jgi:transglutaminase-like putative cysteine protease
MSVHYAIRHLTRFRYPTPVSESVMELRMRPSNTAQQRCLQFEVEVQPRARVFAYRDYRGNWVHHFDLPRPHTQLVLAARAQVQLDDPAPLPERLPMDAWRTIDEWDAREDEWEYRQPSRFAEWSPALVEFAAAIETSRRYNRDPLTTALDTMATVHRSFEYAPNSTRVDSPIDETLVSRRGVCQDFTHIMLATLRWMGVPSRYVSGYIAPRAVSGGDEPTTIATHAWVEVLLPELGWVGLDPTHNLQTGLRHVRVAVGRDYADVPPTRGTFKGQTASMLEVSVEVTPAEALPTLDRAVLDVTFVHETAAAADDERDRVHQQQQQQQQQ